MVEWGQSDLFVGGRSQSNGVPDVVRLFSDWDAPKNEKEPSPPQFLISTKTDADSEKSKAGDAPESKNDEAKKAASKNGDEPEKKKDDVQKAESKTGDAPEAKKDVAKNSDPPPSDSKGDAKPALTTRADAPATGDTQRNQQKIAALIEGIQNTLGPLDAGAQKAKVGLRACNRQYLQDLEKVLQAEAAIDVGKKNKLEEVDLKKLYVRLNLLQLDVERVEKDAALEQGTIENPIAAKVKIACLRIASGDDKAVAQGEIELLDIVRQNPAVQVDPDFTEAVIKAYMQMTTMRRDLKLPPWQSGLKADQLQKENIGVSSTNSRAIMVQANDVLWKDSFEKALPLFTDALDAAKKAQPGFENRRLQLFVEGLSLSQKLASAAVNNHGDIELLKEKRKSLYEAELEAYDETQILKSIEVNVALAKLATGRVDLSKEAKGTLEHWLERDSSLLTNKEFKDSLRGAFVAHLAAVEKANAAAAGKPVDKAKAEPSFKDKFDVATVYGAPQRDEEVRKYTSDLATDIGLAAFLLGSTFLMLRRQRNIYLANRAIRAEFGPTPVEGAPKSVVLKDFNGVGISERSVEVKGKMPGTDLMVLRDPSARKDWKGLSGIQVPEGFDPKAGKYGEFKRLHVRGTDYFVGKDKQVFVLQKDKLIPTSEIILSSPTQFEKQTSTTNSLLDLRVADTVRSLINSHPPGSPVYDQVAKYLNIPTPTVEFSVFENAMAAYKPGKGVIVMKPETKYYKGSDALNERTRLMIHEMTHLEQDTLMIRRLADDLKIGKSFTDKDVEALQKAYESPGKSLDADFARRVLTLRAGVPLTKSESQRVDNLMNVQVRDWIRHLTVKRCDRDFQLLLSLDKSLRPRGELAPAEKTINTANAYKRFADSPERFKELFGIEPSPEVAKIMEKFKNLREGEVPYTFNSKDASDALKDCLEKRYRVLESATDVTNETRYQHTVLTEYLADIGHPVDEAVRVDSFCKKIAGSKAYNLILGENPPKEIVELFDKVATGKMDGWSEDKARELVRQHLAKRLFEVNALRSDSYFACGIEQEAWEGTRKIDLSANVGGRYERDFLHSYELAMQLAGNHNCREISRKILEVTSKPGFADLTPAQKSKELSEVVTKLLKAQLPDGVELPGSVKDIEVKVGDFKHTSLEVDQRAGKIVFEIRIPEKMLGTTDGCIDVVSKIYANVYRVAALDVSARGFTAASLVARGTLYGDLNSESTRAMCKHVLSNPDSLAFGEKATVSFVAEALPALRPVKTTTFLSDNPVELLEQARLTKSLEEAKACIEKLAEMKSPNIDLIKELKEIAKGQSAAVIPAIVQLSVLDRPAFDQIMSEHMKSQFFPTLISTGNADAAAFLKLLSPREREKFFETTWKELPPTSKAKADLAAAAIELKPLSTKFAVALPEAVRSRACDFLLEVRPTGYERKIYEYMKASPEHAAKLKPILDQLWTTQTQPTDGKTTAVSELLIGDRLRVGTKQLGDINWTDGTKTPEKLFEDFKALKGRNVEEKNQFLSRIEDKDLRSKVEKDLYNKEAVDKLLEGLPESKKEYEELYKCLSKEVDLRLELHKCVEARRMILEKALKEFCHASGLPEPTIKIDPFEGRAAVGQHRFGERSIYIRTDLLLSGTSPSDLLVRAILHETLHMEQGTTVVRDILDHLKVGKTISPDQIVDAKAEWVKRVGGVLDTDFLLEVAKVRDGENLTPEQHQRALIIGDAVLKRNAEKTQAKQNAALLDTFNSSWEKGSPLSSCLAKTDLVSAAKRLLVLDKLPGGLEADLQKLEALGIDSVEAKELAKAVGDTLHDMAPKRKNEIMSLDLAEYKANIVEVEAAMGDSRVLVFREAYKIKPAATDKPSSLEGTDPTKLGADMLSVADYTKLPSAFRANMLGKLNWDVCVFLNNPKWDSLKPHEQAAKAKKAVEMMMPALKQHAKLLGLPEEMITSDQIVFESMELGRTGAYSLERDRIRLNVFGEFPVNTVIHELVHRMQWLQIVAAAKTEPLGFRMAMMDSCLAGYDLSKTILTDSGTATRHDFKNPDAKADFRKYVETKMLKEMVGEGLLDSSKVTEFKATDRLIAEFGSEENLRKHADAEVQNFKRIVRVADNCKLSPAAQKYVDSLKASFEVWRHNTAGASLVRVAIADMEKAGNKNARDKASYVEIKARVKALTEKDGRAGKGIEVSDLFIDKVIKEFDAAPAPDLKDPFGVDRTASLDIDPRTFEATERTMRDNPMLRKLLSTATIDHVATNTNARGEYAFSSFEISARKIDAAARAKRIGQLLKEGRLDSVDRNQMQADFRELVEFIRFNTKQQQLHKAMLAGDRTKAREFALELVQMLPAEARVNSDFVDFLKGNKLISDSDLGIKLVAVAESKGAPTDKSSTPKEVFVAATPLDAKEKAVAAKVLGKVNPKNMQIKIFQTLVDSQLLTTIDPAEKETLRSLKTKLAALDPINGPKFVDAIISLEAQAFSNGPMFADAKGAPGLAPGGTEGPRPFAGMDKPAPTAFHPGPASVLDGKNKDPLAPTSDTKPVDRSAGTAKEGPKVALEKGKGSGGGFQKNMGRATGVLILLDAALNLALQEK